jgi:hypothetical protein
MCSSEMSTIEGAFARCPQSYEDNHFHSANFSG